MTESLNRPGLRQVLPVLVITVADPGLASGCPCCAANWLELLLSLEFCGNGSFVLFLSVSLASASVGLSVSSGCTGAAGGSVSEASL